MLTDSRLSPCAGCNRSHQTTPPDVVEVAHFAVAVAGTRSGSASGCRRMSEGSRVTQATLITGFRKKRIAFPDTRRFSARYGSRNTRLLAHGRSGSRNRRSISCRGALEGVEIPPSFRAGESVDGQAVSVSPLTWSHAQLVSVLRGFSIHCLACACRQMSSTCEVRRKISERIPLTILI